MRNIIFLTYLLLSVNLFSQVAVGKSAVTNTSVSLEFGNSGVAPDRTNALKQKGILLPWVSTFPGRPTTDYTGVTTTTNGTLIFDLSDYKVKYLRNGSWFDLTVKEKADTETEYISGSPITNNTIISTIQDTKPENVSAKTSIGTPATPSVPGILVLEDTNKAMILPLVDKYSSVVAPAAGMMVYDLSNDMVCFYNGTVWTFWKQ